MRKMSDDEIADEYVDEFDGKINKNDVLVALGLRAQITDRKKRVEKAFEKLVDMLDSHVKLGFISQKYADKQLADVHEKVTPAALAHADQAEDEYRKKL